MGFFDWISSWFQKNEALLSPKQRQEMREMLNQLQLEMNDSINTSSLHTMRKMEGIINMQSNSLREDLERQKSIHDGKLNNMAKMIADLEAKYKEEKGKKTKEDDDLKKKTTASLEENIEYLVKHLTSTHFMGPSGGYGPGPNGGYGPGPSGGYGPGPSGGVGYRGPGGVGYGPGPGGVGYGPGPSGVGYGPGPGGVGYGPGPNGVNYGPGPNGGNYGPGPSGDNYGNGVGVGPGSSGRSGGPGLSRGHSRGGRGGRTPSPIPRSLSEMTNSGPRLAEDDVEPNVTSLQTQRSIHRAKAIQKHVEDFFNNAENLVSTDGPISLSRTAYSSNSKPMDLIMPESKDSALSQSIGKSSKTVQDWLDRNENPSGKSEEFENDKNSTSGRSIRSTRSTASFVGKRVFTNDSHNNSNKSKTAATKNKKSGKSRKNLTQNTAPKKEVKTDEDQNASLLKSVNYPSEEEAKEKKLNIRDPLKTPVMFIGKKKDGSMESHQPKSLAELYELEKLYETFKVITL